MDSIRSNGLDRHQTDSAFDISLGTRIVSLVAIQLRTELIKKLELSIRFDVHFGAVR